MSIRHCPYCEIKDLAKIKVTFQATEPEHGKCPDCGAWLDAGQHRVDINSYAEIYKGAIRLIDCIMADVNDALAFYDINLNNYLDDDLHGELELSLHTSTILDKLFATGYGGTTKANLAKALGITENRHTWIMTATRFTQEEAAGVWNRRTHETD